MRGNKRRWINWLFNNIVAIITLCFEVFSTISASFKGKEVSSGFFCLIINIPLVICIYKVFTLLRALFKQYRRYKKKRKELRDKAKWLRDNPKESEPSFNYGLSKEELLEDFIARCLAMLLKRSIAFFTFIGIIVFICICNPKNAQAYWNGVETIIGISPQESNISDKPEKDNADSEPKGMEKTVREIRDKKWQFILDDSTDKFELDIKLKKQVFFEANELEMEWEEYVLETVDQWKGEKEGIDYMTIEDKEGNNFFTYTDLEDKFKEKVSDSSQYIYYDEWLKKAPHSSEYDECIKGRESLNAIEVDGKTGCYEICWKLANDYQYYAQEYEQQTTNAEAILYYYAKSIYCCMEALKCSRSEEIYNRTYHFMVMRYHDLYRDECIISQKYKNEMEDIYSILVKSDVKKSTAG